MPRAEKEHGAGGRVYAEGPVLTAAAHSTATVRVPPLYTAAPRSYSQISGM